MARASHSPVKTGINCSAKLKYGSHPLLLFSPQLRLQDLTSYINKQVCLDLPSAVFMPELIAAYPEARVIISQRDPEKWYTSIHETVGRMDSPILHVLAMFDGFFLRPFVSMGKSMNAVWGARGLMDKENAIRVYNDLHEEVRALVPESRRLEFRLGDGWEPLCTFLGKEVPKGCEFPHINETWTFADRIKVCMQEAIRRIASAAAPWVVGAVAAGAAGAVLWFTYLRN
jgi:hypothetical protein